MKNFKIKVEKEDNQDFLIWVLENYKGAVPKNLKGPYYFFEGNKITQSTKYFEFKYSKLTEYVWFKSEKIPVDKNLCGKCVCVDESNRLSAEKLHEVMSKLKSVGNKDIKVDNAEKIIKEYDYLKTLKKPSKKYYDLLEDDIFSAFAEKIKKYIKDINMANESSRLIDEKIKDAISKLNSGNNIDHEIEIYPSAEKYSGNHQNKTMKKQTEYFQIDLSKVDRLEAENIIKGAGGCFIKNSTFTKGHVTLDYDIDDGMFNYSGFKACMLLTITSIPELKKQLGIEEEEMEYVLKEDVTVNVHGFQSCLKYKKGTNVTYEHSINGTRFFKIKEYPYHFHEKHVEEKMPLLSDIVNFGDELEWIIGVNLDTPKFVGKTYSGAYCVYYNGNDKVVMHDMHGFNNKFKLKK